MNEEQEHANFSLRNTLYTNFESLLECICVEGILEVTQAQNAVNWGMAGEQVSMIILLPDKIYPNTCRFILFLPALKPLAAQSFLHTRHVHTIATSTRGPLITIFSVFVITFVPMNVIVFKVWVCSNRIITEGVQALTLPGLITMKKAVLHHFAGLQDLREDEKYGGSRYATWAFATPIFVASATPIFVASATPYFRTFATRTAATPKFFFNFSFV